MSRRWLLSLLCLSVSLLLFTQLTHARGALTVNEAATRFLLDGEQPRVSLAVENASGESLNAIVHLELLDPNDRIKTEVSSTLRVSGGSQKLLIKLPFRIENLAWKGKNELLWYRLRYHLAPAEPADLVAAEGVVSLSAIRIANTTRRFLAVSITTLIRSGSFQSQLRAGSSRSVMRCNNVMNVPGSIPLTRRRCVEF